jgi:hypothetical protein
LSLFIKAPTPAPIAGAAQADESADIAKGAAAAMMIP